MTATRTETSTINPVAAVTTRRRRSRMIRAILAGGLVLGVGAAVTLAAWNDSEFATGTFTAGTFNLEGSTTSATTGFSDHAAAGSAATLTFTLNPTSLTPNDVVAAPFVVRLAANTTNNADVVIAAPTSTGTVTALTYEVVRVATFAACTPSAVDSTGTSLISANTAMTAVAGPNTFALSKGAPVTSAGASQVLCIKVTAGAGLVQAQTGTVTWKFTATSNNS
jgi:predicted ribosomally synthesized peptide with SipW-like signal peptide